MAGALFVLPSLFILIGLTWIYLAYGNVPAVEGILYGIKPAVTAIVIFAAYHIGSKVEPATFRAGGTMVMQVRSMALH